MKLLIADDHSLVRSGIASLLKDGNENWAVIEAADGAEALAAAASHPDIAAVLLDLKMPGDDGHLILEAFASQHPGLPVIILSSSEDPADIRKALAGGALGYVPKSASSRTFLNALVMVLQGEVYVPPQILAGHGLDDELPKSVPAREPRLTDRQTEVLRLIRCGLSNKAIGRELDLSEKTVKVHVTGILRALGITSRAQAIALSPTDAKNEE